MRLGMSAKIGRKNCRIDEVGSSRFQKKKKNAYDFDEEKKNFNRIEKRPMDFLTQEIENIEIFEFETWVTRSTKVQEQLLTMIKVSKKLSSKKQETRSKKQEIKQGKYLGNR